MKQAPTPPESPDDRPQSEPARTSAPVARSRQGRSPAAALGRRLRDTPWSRTPPARVAREAFQRAVLFPVLAFLSPVTVIGRHHLRALHGPAVFVANHQSHVDAPACLAALGWRIRRRLVIAAAADYFYRSSLTGAVAAATLGTVPFHRGGGLGRSSLELLGQLAREGWSVLIFPSGTRGAGDDGRFRFKRGFAYLAVDAQVPVVPLYLHGPDQVMPKGSFIPLPGGVAVGVGDPIPPGDDYADLVRRTEGSMGRLRTVVQRWEAT